MPNDDHREAARAMIDYFIKQADGSYHWLEGAIADALRAAAEGQRARVDQLTELATRREKQWESERARVKRLEADNQWLKEQNENNVARYQARVEELGRQLGDEAHANILQYQQDFSTEETMTRHDLRRLFDNGTLRQALERTGFHVAVINLILNMVIYCLESGEPTVER